MPGGNNPLPYNVGGGPTPFEKVYYALRSMVGIGGSCRYEEILTLTPGTDDTEQDRRAKVVDRWTKVTDAVDDTIRAALQVIDPRFQLLLPTFTLATETQAGRYWAPRDGTEPFTIGPSTRTMTHYPNYSTEYKVYAFLNLGGSGQLPTVADQRSIQRAKDYLNQVLPSWVDFEIFTEQGFNLTVSLLGQGAL